MSDVAERSRNDGWRAGIGWAASIALGAGVLIAATRTTVADRLGPPPGGAPPRVPATAASAPTGTVDPRVMGTVTGAVAARDDLAVVVRLVDALGDAVYDAPGLEKAAPALESHWRRMKAPFVGPRGPTGQAVQIVGFPSGVEKKLRKKPTARVGSHPKPVDGVTQRQAIVAPAPSSIRYRFLVPAGAVFETEVAVAGPPRSVTFQVAVSSSGTRRVLLERRVAHRDAHHWHALRVPLDAFSGQNVELELGARGDGDPGWPPLALWGSPVVLGRGGSSVPLNVLWVSMDALRPDAIAAFHDDETDRRWAAGEPPPLDAWLPRMDDVAPTLNALARESAICTRAWSVATWTRPGMTAMLAGMRSSELGLTTTRWALSEPELTRFYRADPPLMPLVLRRHGFHTRAWVNDFFLVGYSALGLDLGFESVEDYRDPIEDTREITDSALAWLRGHARERFAMFVHYNSPHAPYTPQKALLDSIPKPPRGPSHPLVRSYLAEVKKDDRAIGELLGELDRLGLRDKTIVVVTSDHGETLSAAHDWTVTLDGHVQNMRFRHAPAIWEETARVPIILRLPGRVPAGGRVNEPVLTTDIWPTLLELFGLPKDPRITGRSLLPALRGEKLPPLPIIVEGRAARSIQVQNLRLIERDAAARVRGGRETSDRTYELYDLARDPGERRNLMLDQHARGVELVKLLHVEMERTRNGVIGSPRHAAASVAAPAGKVRAELVFVGGGVRRRVGGLLRATEAVAATGPAERPIGARIVRGAEASSLKPKGRGFVVDFFTDPRHAITLEVEFDGASRLAWDLTLDGQPWPANAAHVGALGTSFSSAVHGLGDDATLSAAVSPSMPYVDPRKDVGLFVTVDRGEARAAAADAVAAKAAHEETMQLLREWGYVGGSH